MIIRKASVKLKRWLKELQYVRELPERIIVLLANPRSGSTWLFDALRCHPTIYVHPNSVIYERLGLAGRRYPRDLSNGLDAIQKIEVRPGRWEWIPTFDVSDMACQTPVRFLRETYAIEKCHPEFFRFDASVFLDNVRRLEDKGVQLKFVYQVRDPQASIVSFIDYQNRNPTWYPTTKGIRLAIYMCQTYEAILEVAKYRRGLIIGYADIVTDLESVLQEIYSYLWPNPTSEEIHFILQVSQATVKATSRDKRAATGSPFLGRMAGPVKGSSAECSNFFDRYNAKVTQCHRSYELLLDLA